ncbi:hypothetical protein [Streptomyces albipurpureus]|uniref:Uncharacterized protein n=1 Tax=Streptomyces albipurpureus TaxID=2897419 RepID=A0ABT0URY9_9ACTN|nr:hypothetical protein [Streptomyces sp. CWNU-1]MCM2391323.1 hypothetical protein [Streptomyces sp. CWNU-1]
MTSYPRQDGRPLPAWTAMCLEARQDLAEETPHRLQRLMYMSNAVDVPADAFAAHTAAAGRRLRKLLRDDPNAMAYFNGWTFAAAADTADPMRAAEAEYYLCDALIEYGAQVHDFPGHPVLDPSLYGLYEEEQPA